MSLTEGVKREICAVTVTSREEIRAEVSSTLRLAGGINRISGRVVVDADLDHAPTAKRLRDNITKYFGYEPELIPLGTTGKGSGNRYLLRVVSGGAKLASMTGLLDIQNQPVRGLPPQVVLASKGVALAVWRGAFLAAGTLSGPGQAPSLEVRCPSFEVALALVGGARRLNITARHRCVRGAELVVVRDTDAITKTLRLLGARGSVSQWEQCQDKKEAQTASTRLANFENSNQQRSVNAGIKAAARLEHAFRILGDEIPEGLREFGQLRIAHPNASLEELGKMANPPKSKDTAAGRIRRLIALADKKAAELGVANTQEAVNEEMLNQ